MGLSDLLPINMVNEKVYLYGTNDIILVSQPF